MPEDENLSLEKILEENPDYIFVQTTDSDIESSPVWSTLFAVINDRYIEAYKGLVEIIYPEIFEQIDGEEKYINDYTPN